MYRSAYRVLMLLPLMFCSVGIYLAVRAWFSPQSTITVSTSTTWVTDHIDENGFVDYEKAMNLKRSQSTPPDRNAALGLVKAFGIDSLAEKNRAQYLHDLQTDVLEVVGDVEQSGADKRHFQNLSEFTNGKSATELLNRINGQPSALDEQETAQIKEWLASNDLPVRAALAAIDLPDFYFPIHRDSVNEWVLVGNQPFLNKCRELSTFLNVRAMRALGDNDIASAARDALAIRKLGRKLSNGATPFELYFSCEIELSAVVIEKQLLNCDTLTAEQLIAYRDQLQSLPPRGDMTEKLDSGLRMLMLDSVNKLAKIKNSKADSPQNHHPRHRDPFFLFQKFDVDFDEAMRQVNLRLDQVVQAVERPCAQDQIIALRKIGLLPLQRPDAALALSLLMRSPSGRGQMLADLIGGYMLPAQEAFFLKASELVAYDRLIPLAFTIQARYKDGNALPAIAAELNPEMPLSPYDLSPVVYEKTESGFRLLLTPPSDLRLSAGMQLPEVMVSCPKR